MHPSSPQKVTPEWLRYPEAERYSGLGRSTLTKLVSFGEIKAAQSRQVGTNQSCLSRRVHEAADRWWRQGLISHLYRFRDIVAHIIGPRRTTAAIRVTLVTIPTRTSS